MARIPLKTAFPALIVEAVALIAESGSMLSLFS